jgi:protein-S-isoprenylcysteine O-methyltransferase Ste14
LYFLFIIIPTEPTRKRGYHLKNGKRTSKTFDAFPILARIVFFVGLLISALDSAIHNETFNYNIITILGFILFVVGLGIYGVARFTLRRFFSEELKIKPDHKLITFGPYHFIRHPIYLGEIFYFLSIPIIFGSLFGFVIMLVLLPLLLYRIRIEEKLLISEFGREYVDYTHRTKKLIPHIY